jgi:hypothetical protein
MEDAERTGNFTTLLGILADLYPGLFAATPKNVASDLSMAFLVSRALVEGGDNERGSRILNLWSDEVTSYEDVYGVTAASVELDLLLGDTKAALAKLKKLEPRKFEGAFDRTYIIRDKLWQEIADEPQLLDLIDELEQHVAEQQSVLQAMERQEDDK